MKKTFAALLLISLSFSSGFAFKSLLDHQEFQAKKVTGIGGIFFRCQDPAKMRAWYSKHLGLNTNNYGAVFEWRQGADSSLKGFTQWSPFPSGTKYFGNSGQAFMINYRVQDLDALVKELKAGGVDIVDTVASYDYGKFVHITDTEGNRVELWEPYDAAYEAMGRQMGSRTTK